jgi:hypothetical protein
MRRWEHAAGVLGKDETEREKIPIFTFQGKPLDTEGVCTMVREAVAWLHLDPLEYGAVSLRIAGATELRDSLGPIASKEIIQARGRWYSDIHFLYERVTAVEMLEASVGVGTAGRPELERVLGVAQTVRRQR